MHFAYIDTLMEKPGLHNNFPAWQALLYGVGHHLVSATASRLWTVATVPRRSAHRLGPARPPFGPRCQQCQLRIATPATRFNRRGAGQGVGGCEPSLASEVLRLSCDCSCHPRTPQVAHTAVSMDNSDRKSQMPFF